MISKPILLVSYKKPQSRLFHININIFVKEADNTGMEEKTHAKTES